MKIHGVNKPMFIVRTGQKVWGIIPTLVTLWYYPIKVIRMPFPFLQLGPFLV